MTLQPHRHGLLRLAQLSCLVLSLTCLSLLFPTSSAHFLDPTVAAFPIGPSSTAESHTVYLPSPSPYSCTFTHTTVPEVINLSSQPTRFNMVDYLSSMSGRGDCVHSTSNYWDYEVCMLAGVRQSKAGETYGLGRERVVREMTLLFKGGDQCATQLYNGPRETTVAFACDPTSTSPHISSIAEPSTCHYEVTITTLAVCGDSRFSIVQAGTSSEDKAMEDWFLEITHLHGHDSDAERPQGAGEGRGEGHVVEAMCSVYSMEARAKRSELNFAQWELRIDREERDAELLVDAGSWGAEEEGHGKRKAETPLVVVRHPGRRVMDEEAYEVELEKDHHVVRNTDRFNGQLAYVKLYA